MNVSVPAAAPPTPPETGASIIRSCEANEGERGDFDRPSLLRSFPPKSFPSKRTCLLVAGLGRERAGDVRVDRGAVDQEGVRARDAEDLGAVDLGDVRGGREHRDHHVHALRCLRRRPTHAGTRTLEGRARLRGHCVASGRGKDAREAWARCGRRAAPRGSRAPTHGRRRRARGRP